jgi:hypothetical protein
MNRLKISHAIANVSSSCAVSQQYLQWRAVNYVIEEMNLISLAGSAVRTVLMLGYSTVH